MKALEIGKDVIQKEIDALQNVYGYLDKTFENILELITECQGKVIFIGMGKSGHVAHKIAASMSSLGTCAISLHPSECAHGDLGMIQKQDVVVLISYSGESEEIINIIPSIRIIGAKIIGITCNENSTLAKSSEIVQVFHNIEEACHLGLAPTASTTVVMAYGDALSVAASRLRGFDKNNFGIFHPAGSLGKRLTVRVVDLMKDISEKTKVYKNSTLTDALIAISENVTDILPVVDQDGILVGIVTNGDLKRAVREKTDIYSKTIQNLIHYYPYFVDASAMAIDGLKIMEENKIHSLPVVREEKVIGVIEKKEILKSGIYI